MTETISNPGSSSEQSETQEDGKQEEWDSGVKQPTTPWSAEQSIESPKEKASSSEEMVSSDVIRDQDDGNTPDEAPATHEVGNPPTQAFTESPSWLEGLTGAKQDAPERDQIAVPQIENSAPVDQRFFGIGLERKSLRCYASDEISQHCLSSSPGSGEECEGL
jgi:hypothetical protein